MKKINAYLFAIGIFSIFCCFDCEDDDRSVMSPIYYPDTLDISTIEVLLPQPFEDLGNLVLYQDKMFIVDQLKGVHVIDNSNPEDPKNTAFIRIPSVTQATMDDGHLIVNFLSHLLVLDVRNLPNLKITDQIRDYYGEGATTQYPLNYTGNFECVNPTLGTVIGWEPDFLSETTCWR